jgi:hypothetical protein
MHIRVQFCICSVLSSLPLPTQQLIVLLFGTWFRTANHVQYSSMSSEALGKSVAGSMFHTCALDQHRAERAARVIRLMIEDFAVASMFGHDNLQYFAEVTGTCLQVKEHFRYEFRYSVDDSDALDNGMCCKKNCWFDWLMKGQEEDRRKYEQVIM